ncbi:Ger(x)C family spore germination protein [Metabacillus litoralis]|uniref:Ger(X)C family spore germination protein n=1 Tax=Metabacillus litoralis TaxID=152268 RepID=A0A5C6W3V1_9BACI|nr:Ger(x)C family spore germination protein [Metabacillus litoralis]
MVKAKMIRRLLLLTIVLLLFLTSGCGYKDIDKRFFVVSIGVDKSKEENKYDVTLKLAVPSNESKSGSDEAKIITESAQSISEAVRLMKSKVDKEFDFSHAKVIVFGEELAKGEDLEHIFDWFERRRDIKDIAWAAIGSPTALEVLEAKPVGERIPSNSLFLTFSSAGTETPYIHTVYLFDFTRKQVERGVSPILPIIKTEENELAINTISIFSNMKVALVLEKEQTKFLNMLMVHVSKFDIRVDNEDNSPYFIFSTDNVKANYDLIVNEKSPSKISYKIKVNGVVEEAFDDLEDTKIKEYEKLLEKQLESKILDLLMQLQKEKVDPIGFGLKYRAMNKGKESEKIETWNNIYSNLEFDINVTAEMDHVGVIHDEEELPE